MVSPNLIPSLELIKATSSGLNEFQRGKFSQELSYIQDLDAATASEQLATRIKIAPFLHLFLTGKYQELKDLLISDPSLIALGEIKALKILNLLILGELLSLRDFFPLATDKNAVPTRSIEYLSRHIIKLYSAISLHTNLGHCEERSDEAIHPVEFRTLKLSILEEHLNGISLRYAEFILRNQVANKYSEVWEILSPYSEIDDSKIDTNVSDLRTQPQVQVPHLANDALEATRLLAIYKRFQGDLIGAERYSYLYHKYFKPDTEKRAHLVTHANTVGFPAAQVLPHWGELLAECDEIQSAVMKEAGLENSTCEYFSCTDCCTHTFPVMSYTEFIYLRDWLLKNNYPIAELEKRCSEIQSVYEEKYGSRLTVLDKNLPANNIRGIENPHDFKYSCPFLSADGRCSCYAARPLLCRGFGLSTDNGISIKSCQHFITQYQHGASTDGERDVYDLRQIQTLARASDKHLSVQEDGVEKVLSGTLVAWFSRNVT